MLTYVHKQACITLHINTNTYIYTQILAEFLHSHNAKRRWRNICNKRFVQEIEPFATLTISSITLTLSHRSPEYSLPLDCGFIRLQVLGTTHKVNLLSVKWSQAYGARLPFISVCIIIVHFVWKCLHVCVLTVLLQSTVIAILNSFWRSQFRTSLCTSIEQ